MTNTSGDSCGGKCESKTKSKPPHVSVTEEGCFTALFSRVNKRILSALARPFVSRGFFWLREGMIFT